MKKRPVFQELMQRLKEPRKFIHVLLGPRQVGKTTLVRQAVKSIRKPCHYISADLATLQDLSWLQKEWNIVLCKLNFCPLGSVKASGLSYR